jgi:riboflavin biosynthesis pyrimidine reductase
MRLTDSIGAVPWGLPARTEFANYFTNLLAGRLGNSAALVLYSTGSDRDPSGTSLGISNPLDRAFLVTLRNRSAMVVTTGSTVRAEGVHFPTSGRLAILSNQDVIRVPKVSGSGELMRITWLSGEHGSQLASAAAEKPFQVVTADGRTLTSDGSLELESLRAQRGLHFEAGVATLVKFWNAGLIDQLWLTHPVGVETELFDGAQSTVLAVLGALSLSLLQPLRDSASL